jgi:hypothetical protein
MSQPNALSALLFVITLVFTPTARAGLVITPPAIDLGEIRGGTTHAQRFTLTNDGTERVEIADVRPGCGCLAPKLDRRVLGPGETATLTLQVRALGQPNGPRSWNVRVRSRQGERDVEQVLVVAATIRNDVTVQPAILALSVATTLRQEIIVTDTRTPPLRVTAVRATLPAVATRVEPAAAGVTRIILDVTAAALPPGRHDGLVSVYTDDPDYSPLEVPLTLQRAADRAVVAVPPHVRARVAPGQPISTTLVRLRPTGDEKLVIEAADCDDPAIRCTWAAGPDNGATLRVRVDGRRVSAGEHHVRVRLSEPRTELTIPIERD